MLLKNIAIQRLWRMHIFSNASIFTDLVYDWYFMLSLLKFLHEKKVSKTREQSLTGLRYLTLHLYIIYLLFAEDVIGKVRRAMQMSWRNDVVYASSSRLC